MSTGLPREQTLRTPQGRKRRRAAAGSPADRLILEALQTGEDPWPGLTPRKRGTSFIATIFHTT